MARDATDTRERLLTTAQTLFPHDGIYQVPLKRIVERAGQRNASALHYHFGGRDGLLHAIIVRHDGRIQDGRHRMMTRLEAEGRTGDLRALVEALVEPFSTELDTASGCEYLQIVSQLSMLSTSGTSTSRTVRPRPSVCSGRWTAFAAPRTAAASERITTLLGLVTEALAMRARVLDAPGSHPPALDNDQFVANLVDMSVGALSAPTTTHTN